MEVTNLENLDDQKFFETCMDNMFDRIVVMEALRNKQGNIIDFFVRFANKSVCKAHQKSREELLGRKMSEIWPGLTGEAFKKYCRVCETGEPIESEVFTYQDQKKKIDGVYERQVVQVNDGIAVTVRDITEQKRIQELQKQSEQRLSNIIDKCPIGIMVVDGAGTVQVFNQALYSIPPGREWEGAVGRSYFNVVAKLGVSKEDSPMYWALQGWPTVNQRFNRAGRVVNVSVTPVYSEGKITGAIGVFQDVTDSLEKEREHVQALERFRKIFTNSISLMVIVRAADMTYLDVNEAWEKTTGFTRAEVIGKTPSELGFHVCQAEGETVKVKEQEDLDGGQPYEISFETKYGERRVVLCQPTLIQGGGEDHILYIGFDITKLKKYEQEMAQLDRLNIVGEMAAGIAHEVRNPLTTIRGYLQMLKVKQDFVKYDEHFSTMIEELDRANTIITEFLSLAKEKKLEIQHGNLNKVILSMLPIIQADAFSRGHELHVDIGEIPDSWFDLKEIRQLILNLVRNAFEAMEPGGEVIIRTFWELGAIKLAVQDTGPGIPDDIMKKLGTPFVTTKDNGTGLGLPVCFRIAETHRAKIDIETGPQGATFTVIFSTPDEGGSIDALADHPC